MGLFFVYGLVLFLLRDDLILEVIRRIELVS